MAPALLLDHFHEFSSADQVSIQIRVSSGSAGTQTSEMQELFHSASGAQGSVGPNIQAQLLLRRLRRVTGSQLGCEPWIPCKGPLQRRLAGLWEVDGPWLGSSKFGENSVGQRAV